MAMAALLVSAALLALHVVACHGQLLVHSYDFSCPRAESIVSDTVNAAFKKDNNSPAKLLRLFFHDCFVRGCDGSILIDSTTNNTAEKGAIASSTVEGYEIIDQAKATLETVCAGTVSCADILALAARDAVVAAGGPVFDMPTGRRDGTVSIASEAAANIPDPASNVDKLVSVFNSKGLSQTDLVILSGAHTIGVARCGAFSDRFNTKNGTTVADPTLDPAFASSLQTKCPLSAANPTTTVPLDTISSTQFDNAYYVNLQQGKGLLSSDEVLFTDPRTKSIVGMFAGDKSSFFANFQMSLVKMSTIGVKTGTEGQIRTNCRVVKSS